MYFVLNDVIEFFNINYGAAMELPVLILSLISAYKLKSIIPVGIMLIAISTVLPPTFPWILTLAVLGLTMVGFRLTGIYRRRLSPANIGPEVNLMILIALNGTLEALRLINLTSYQTLLSLSLLFEAYGFLMALRPWTWKVRYTSSPLAAATLVGIPFIASFTYGAALTFLGSSGITSMLALGYVSLPWGAPWDALSFLVTVTASPWFMIVMGIWLSVLVIDKIKETKKLSNKVRLGLMFSAYWVYSIYLPSFSPISSQFPNIPYSWFNGLGTFGPVEPSLFLGLLGTYAVTAALSFFFGSRQICSVTCTAPFMLQGSLIDSMKVYNRTSKAGRKFLTSRTKSFFRIASMATWISLLGLAILSFTNSVGLTNVSILGNDPSVVPTMIYFNFIWYIQFLAIPLLGDYACVNHGICGWGTFNQLMGYLGPFRLKAKDPQVCLTCKTVDCAKSCPVGLTDMRASFIRKGEFKAFRCIGTGECIDDCPHDNIFIVDGRKKLKEIFTFSFA